MMTFEDGVLGLQSGNRLELSYILSDTYHVQFQEHNDISKSFVSLSVENSKKVRVSIKTTDGTKKEFDIILQTGAHTLYWYPFIVGEIEHVVFSYDVDEFKDIYFEYAIDVNTIPSDQIRGRRVITASLEDILYLQKNTELVNGLDDFMLFRWQSYPDVLIFSFASRDIQALYLKRMAFFAEKTQTRGSVEKLEDISHRKGWGAHDYKAKDFVDFYNELAAQNLMARSENGNDFDIITLNNEEQHLQKILLDDSIILKKSSKKNPVYEINPNKPNDSVISFARSDSLGLQKVLLYHELLHTFYFRDEELQQEIHEVWNRLSPASQKIWRGFMKNNGYDSEYDYLIKNELFAYLLQRPILDLPWYIPARIIPESKVKVTQAEANEFTNELILYAKLLSNHFYEKYKLLDGNTAYVISD